MMQHLNAYTAIYCIWHIIYIHKAPCMYVLIAAFVSHYKLTLHVNSIETRLALPILGHSKYILVSQDSVKNSLH